MARLSTPIIVGLAAIVGFGSGAVLNDPFQQDPRTAVAASAASDPSCNIKGNISINTGERIYHVPGQRYYAETVISPEYGERYFCSEAEARAAGWRRSRI